MTTDHPSNQNIDATNTNIHIRWQVFSIDKPGIATQAYGLGYDEAITRGFTSSPYRKLIDGAA